MVDSDEDEEKDRFKESESDECSEEEAPAALQLRIDSIGPQIRTSLDALAQTRSLGRARSEALALARKRSLGSARGSEAARDRKCSRLGSARSDTLATRSARLNIYSLGRTHLGRTRSDALALGCRLVGWI